MASFGEMLRRERELRQISLREVAESTKINLRYLDALEKDDFRHLPGGVFNKGFVRAVAQYIGVDPEAMVNAYLDEERLQRERDHAANEARLRLIGTSDRVERTTTPIGGTARMWLAACVVAVLVLVAAAVVVLVVRFGGPGRWFNGSSGPSAAIPAAAAAAQGSSDSPGDARP